MTRFKVSYTTHKLWEIEVDADSPEEAARLINDDEADFDKALPIEEEFCEVTGIEEVSK